ncbi:MAG: hypothetical protein ACOYL8_02040 [Patescibacteria group bacterium]
MSITWPTDGAKKSPRLKLFQARRSIKFENGRLTITRWQYRRLKKFYIQHKTKFFWLFLCLIVQSLLEISLPVFSSVIVKEVNIFIYNKQIVSYLSVLFLGVAVYLVSAFLYLLVEKTLIIQLINELREHWFKLFLYRAPNRTNSRDKAKLLAKVTYHFSLLQVSLGASIGGALRWTINFFVLLAFALTSSWSLVFYVLASSIFSIILLVIGYYIGLYYLSREASLSSAIISHISEQADQVSLLQNQAREKESINQMRRLVALDSVLKIRRTLWMNYGNKLIYSLIVISTVLVIVVPSIFPDINFASLLSGIDIFFGLIVALLIRQLYLGLRIGLNAVPTQIGLSLSLPQPESPRVRLDKVGEFKEIVFKSKKFKLTPGGSYFKNVEILFKSGCAYLFFGELGSGKNQLAKIFSGRSIEEGKPWIIRLNGERYLYKEWRRVSRRAFFVSGKIAGGASLAEIISGEAKTKIKSEQIEKICLLIEEIPALNFLNNIPKLIAANIDQTSFTEAEKVLVELAYCLIREPNLIVIDDSVFYLPDPRIKEMLEILAPRLKKSIIILFSRHKLDYLDFTNIYEINKKFFKENS